MKLYGKTLVTNAPAASTELLKRLCDGFEEEVDSLAFDSVESTSSFEDSPTVSEGLAVPVSCVKGCFWHP